MRPLTIITHQHGLLFIIVIIESLFYQLVLPERKIGDKREKKYL